MNIGKNTVFYDRNTVTVCSEGVTVGDDCKIHKYVWLGKDVQIGNGCLIQAFAFIPEGVTIEHGVFIGPHVVFTNDKRPPSYGAHWANTLVKKGASIGANCTILPGVTIGEGAMIGAGSVVTKDVPDGETWVGNPAHLHVTKGPKRHIAEAHPVN